MTESVEETSSTYKAVSQRVPIWRDVVVIKWVTQVSLLAVVLAALWFLAGQAGENLKARNINTGFDFLERPPDIQLSEGIDTAPATGGRALWVGMVNTLRMAIVGILFASLLGLIVGLSRLSNNWLIRRLAGLWIETLRNVPLLVQIIFYFAVLTALPRVSLESGPINGWFHVSNKGVSLPRLFIADGFYQWFIVLLLGFAVAFFVKKQRVKKQDATGENPRTGVWVFSTIAFFAFIGLFIHPAFSFFGSIFGAIANLIDSVPIPALQVTICILLIYYAGSWIRNFLINHKSATGHISLTDDDRFRMIFAAVGATLLIILAFTWPGISSWILNSSRDLFEVLESKFNVNGAARPFDGMKPDIVKPGKFANYGVSGLTMTPSFAAVFFGVVFYTSAFIGEIIRGGILAVPKGQIEAANAVGLNRSQSLRQVILPQAIRIILPPLGNQYLNLTKNTSLAIAVGYSDIVQVGQTVYNQTGKSLPVMSIWMLFYLACSLTISVIVNYYNVKMKIVER